MRDEFTKWRDRALWAGITAGIGSIIGWGAWANLAINDRPTHGEVRDLLGVSPYSAERAMILKQLDNVAAAQDQLVHVIEGNTNAINALRTELARQAGINEGKGAGR